MRAALGPFHSPWAYRIPFILHMSAPLEQQTTCGLSQTIRQWGCNEIQQHTAPPAPDDQWDLKNWVNEACICGIPPFQVVLHFCPTRPTKTFFNSHVVLVCSSSNHFGTIKDSLWRNNHHCPSLVRQAISCASYSDKTPKALVTLVESVDSSFYGDPSHPSMWANIKQWTIHLYSWGRTNRKPKAQCWQAYSHDQNSQFANTSTS